MHVQQRFEVHACNSLHMYAFKAPTCTQCGKGKLHIRTPHHGPVIVRCTCAALPAAGRDDVGDHERWAQHFKAQRILHAEEVVPDTQAVEVKLAGAAAWRCCQAQLVALVTRQQIAHWRKLVIHRAVGSRHGGMQLMGAGWR
jgi:hypothetical protein